MQIPTIANPVIEKRWTEHQDFYTQVSSEYHAAIINAHCIRYIRISMNWRQLGIFLR